MTTAIDPVAMPRPRGPRHRATAAHAGARVLAPPATGAPASPSVRRAMAGHGMIGSASPAVEDDTTTGTDVAEDRPWDVIVWDDPVNLMSYVVWVFMRVFAFPEPVARKLMLEVHHHGKSLVASEPREQAELYLQQLHGYGLQATIQRSG